VSVSFLNTGGSSGLAWFGYIKLLNLNFSRQICPLYRFSLSGKPAGLNNNRERWGFETAEGEGKKSKSNRDTAAVFRGRGEEDAVPARSQLRGSQLRRRLVALQPRRHPQGQFPPSAAPLPSVRNEIVFWLKMWFLRNNNIHRWSFRFACPHPHPPAPHLWCGELVLSCLLG
jgi:hypothetical protein